MNKELLQYQVNEMDFIRSVKLALETEKEKEARVVKLTDIIPIDILEMAIGSGDKE